MVRQESKKRRLNQSLAEKTKPNSSEFTIWDTEISGFGLRIHPSGKKSLILMYRYYGRLRKRTLGTLDKINVDAARRAARKELAILATGEDPTSARNQNDKTVDSLCDNYVEEYAKPKKKTWYEDQRRLNKWIRPAWGKLRADSIRRIDVEKLYARIGQNGRYEANRVLSLLSKVFALAARWGYIPETAPNPARNLERYKEKRRDRWITPEEMPRLVEAISQEESVYHRAGLLLYLLTGMRNRELVRRRWSDLDLVRGELVLEDTKAGRSYRVKLSSAAIEIFKEIPRETGSEWIFPGREKNKPMAQFSRRCWNRVRERLGMPDLRIHDLRRTFGSWLASQGTPLKIIAGLLNQSSQSITDTVYAQLADDPLREASESVGDKIISIMEIKREIKTG